LNIGAGPRLFNPESGYYADVAGGNYAGKLNTEMQNMRQRLGWAELAKDSALGVANMAMGAA
jgi:hypothetical protein